MAIFLAVFHQVVGDPEGSARIVICFLDPCVLDKANFTLEIISGAIAQHKIVVFRILQTKHLNDQKLNTQSKACLIYFFDIVLIFVIHTHVNKITMLLTNFC